MSFKQENINSRIKDLNFVCCACGLLTERKMLFPINVYFSIHTNNEIFFVWYVRQLDIFFKRRISFKFFNACLPIWHECYWWHLSNRSCLPKYTEILRLTSSLWVVFMKYHSIEKFSSHVSVVIRKMEMIVLKIKLHSISIIIFF